VEVPTIDGGRSRVKVPAGHKQASRCACGAKGMPALRGGGLGDMVLELAVETPVNLTSRQREILLEFEKAERREQPRRKEFLFQGEGVLGRDEELIPAA
jgi:molecular chaperone DnaJ